MDYKTSKDMYYDNLRKVGKTLSLEEELRLGRQARLGDTAARDALIKANTRLVIYIAQKMCYDPQKLEEAISDGNMGLVEAVRDFNPAKGKRVGALAGRYILNQIRNNAKRRLRESRDSDLQKEDLRGSIYEHDLSRTIQQYDSEMVRYLIDKLGEREQKIILLNFGFKGDRPLSLSEIGKQMNLTKERVRQLKEKALGRLRYHMGINNLDIDDFF